MQASTSIQQTTAVQALEAKPGPDTAHIPFVIASASPLVPRQEPFIVHREARQIPRELLTFRMMLEHPESREALLKTIPPAEVTEGEPDTRIRGEMRDTEATFAHEFQRLADLVPELQEVAARMRPFQEIVARAAQPEEALMTREGLQYLEALSGYSAHYQTYLGAITAADPNPQLAPGEPDVGSLWWQSRAIMPVQRMPRWTLLAPEGEIQDFVLAATNACNEHRRRIEGAPEPSIMGSLLSHVASWLPG